MTVSLQDTPFSGDHAWQLEGRQARGTLEQTCRTMVTCPVGAELGWWGAQGWLSAEVGAVEEGVGHTVLTLPLCYKLQDSHQTHLQSVLPDGHSAGVAVLPWIHWEQLRGR